MTCSCGSVRSFRCVQGRGASHSHVLFWTGDERGLGNLVAVVCPIKAFLTKPTRESDQFLLPVFTDVTFCLVEWQVYVRPILRVSSNVLFCPLQNVFALVRVCVFICVYLCVSVCRLAVNFILTRWSGLKTPEHTRGLWRHVVAAVPATDPFPRPPLLNFHLPLIPLNKVHTSHQF